MQLNYISSFHVSSHTERQKELQTVLLKNINNPIFRSLYYFVDNDIALRHLEYLIKKHKNSHKIKIIGVKKAKYSDLFEYSMTLAGEICVIANSDIYFHVVPQKFIRYLASHPNCIYAVTRYESDFSKPLIENYTGSHDAFFFASPIKETILSKINHFQYFPGAENIVIHELLKSGYKLYNPCLDIITVHLHTKRIPYENPRINNHIKTRQTVYPSTIDHFNYKYKLKNLFNHLRNKLIAILMPKSVIL